MMINNSFEELCQALRVVLEAHTRAHRGNLLQVDRAEAVGNIEIGHSAVLNAFHSLYDAIHKIELSEKLNWYDCGELATVLAIRNARHHNHANKIRTQYTYHVQEAFKPTKMVSYVLVDFPSPDPTADTFDLYLSWADMMTLFALPEKQTRLRERTKSVIRQYLGSDKFASYAEHFDMPEKRVFFNAPPLFVNAAAKIVPIIATNIKPASTEAEFFLDHFSTVEPAQTDKPVVDCGPFCCGVEPISSAFAFWRNGLF